MASSAEEWVSLREFARRRGVELRAVQKAIESGRVTAVKRDEKGRLAAIEVAAATMQWDTNTDPVAAAKSGKILGQVVRAGEAETGAEKNAATAEPPVAPRQSSPGPGESPDSPNGVSRSATAVLDETDSGDKATAAAAPDAHAPSVAVRIDNDPHGYYEARARREQFQSKQAELDYLQALGELVSSTEMRRISARRYRAIRDKLLNIADRLAAVLAAERDPAQVHAVLTTDIKRVLNELSDDAAAELAEGAAERVAA